MAFLILPRYLIAWFIDLWKFHWTFEYFVDLIGDAALFFQRRCLQQVWFSWWPRCYSVCGRQHVLHWCLRRRGTSPKCSSDSSCCCVISHWVILHVVALLFTCFVCLKLCSFKQNLKVIVDDGGNFALENWTLSGVEFLTEESSKHAFLFHGYWWIPQFEMVQVLKFFFSSEWKPLNFGI